MYSSKVQKELRGYFMRKHLITLLVLNLFVHIGCSRYENSSDMERTNQGLIVANNSSVEYSSTVLPDKTTTQLKIDSLIFDITIDSKNEILSLDGHGASLTESQRLNLQTFYDLYATSIKNKDTQSYEIMAPYYAAGFILKSPENFKFDLITKKIPQEKNKANNNRSNYSSNYNLEIKCLKKGSNTNSTYTDYKGLNEIKNIKVNSIGTDSYGAQNPAYGCMGRCGAGCGNKWIPSAYTQACLNHDVCSVKNNSSGGASDANCGDEFSLAIDDYILGVVKGCNGN
jgi:hypothetical protein